MDCFQELVADIGGYICAIWGIKPYYFSGPGAFLLWCFWVVMKLKFVSAL